MTHLHKILSTAQQETDCHADTCCLPVWPRPDPQAHIEQHQARQELEDGVQRQGGALLCWRAEWSEVSLIWGGLSLWQFVQLEGWPGSAICLFVPTREHSLYNPY